MQFRPRQTTEHLCVRLVDAGGKSYRDLHRQARLEGKLGVDWHYLISPQGAVMMGRHQSQVADVSLKDCETTVYIFVDVRKGSTMTDAQKGQLAALLSSLRVQYPGTLVEHQTE